MTGEELETLVVRLLTRGVPHSVVADTFDLDPELVRATQKEVRVEQYGTDDMSGYIEQLRWEAIDQARQTLKSGSATERKNILSAVLGKEFAMSARRTPQSTRDSQDAILELLEGMKAGSTNGSAAPSKFIARRSDDAGA